MELLGFTINTETMELSLPPGKLIKNSGGVSEIIGVGASISQRPLQINRQDECHQSRNPTSTTVLQTSTNGSGKGKSRLRDNPCPILGQQGGVVLVGHSDDQMEREDGTVEGDRPDYRIRRGWGASCLGTTTGGPWLPQERTWHINCL